VTKEPSLCHLINMYEEIVKKYKRVFDGSLLFREMSEQTVDAALSIFGASFREYEKGAMLHQVGEPLLYFGFVLEGVVQVCSDDIEGAPMIMADVSAGSTFGEALCYLRRDESPVYIYASVPAKILWLSLDGLYNARLIKGSGGPVGNTVTTDNSLLILPVELQQRFTAMLASRTLTMNNRIQVLSRLKLRDKLITYFTQLAAAAGSRTFNLPLNRNDLATYIGTNRSALSRELSQMKDDGIIDYHRNTVRILK